MFASSPTATILKTCRACGEERSPSEFYGGYRQCKKCYGDKRRAYYLENREKYRIEHRAYYRKSRDRVAHLNRESNLRINYGMTVAQFDEMLVKQGGGCALCAGTNADGRRLAVDHDHATGVVRGLLCGECNQSLGKMKDSPALLRKAADYIEKKGKL